MKLELKDIHLPTEISIWPIAPAWWLIIGLCLALIGLLYWYKGSTLRSKKTHLKQTIAETKQALAELKKQTDHLKVLQSSNKIVKKFLMNATNDPSIAKLHHQQWINYCHSIAKPFTFRKTTQYLLSNALYQPSLEFDIAHYIDELQDWLKQVTKNV